MKTLMKVSLIAVLFLGILSSVATAQEVPAKVQQAFHQKFPDVKKVDWSKESDKEFEAEFILDDQEMSANFSVGGEWKETEVSVSNEDLPNPIKETLTRDFEGSEVEHSFKVTMPDQTVYEVLVSNDDEKRYDEEETEDNEKMEQDEEDEDGEDMNAEKEEEEGHHLQELVFTAAGKLLKKEEVKED